MEPREFKKPIEFKLHKEFNQPTGINQSRRTKFGSYIYLLRHCSALAVFAAAAVLLAEKRRNPPSFSHGDIRRK